MPADIKLLPSSLGRNIDLTTGAASPMEIEQLIQTHVQDLLSFAKETPGSDATFMAFEKGLFARIQDLGRLLIVLFLTVHEARLRTQVGPRIEKAGRQFVRRPAQPRSLNTIFGVVRYFRMYFRGTPVAVAPPI